MKIPDVHMCFWALLLFGLPSRFHREKGGIVGPGSQDKPSQPSDIASMQGRAGHTARHRE
jgi:hypothetical protein